MEGLKKPSWKGITSCYLTVSKGQTGGVGSDPSTPNICLTGRLQLMYQLDDTRRRVTGETELRPLPHASPGWNQFGIAVGGPLAIPHLVSEERGWYVYGWYEGIRTPTGYRRMLLCPAMRN